MTNFYLGCALWAFQGWSGDFYPKGSRSTEYLNLYSDRLLTVEVNSTFYMIPDRQALERWAASTPNNFRFCPKYPKQLSHNGLLLPFLEQGQNFLKLMATLGDRLGVIFMQLPPSYNPQNFDDLSQFLAAIASNSPHRLALEVRHRDWFELTHSDRLNGLLSSLGIGRVLLDSRPIYDAASPPITQQRRKPNLPLQPVVTAPFSIIRFVSHPQADLNFKFWQEWTGYLQEWLAKGTEVYFFVHCPIEERSPHNAKNFQEILEKANLAIPPLPWQSLTPPPQQLTLWS